MCDLEKRVAELEAEVLRLKGFGPCPLDKYKKLRTPEPYPYYPSYPIYPYPYYPYNPPYYPYNPPSYGTSTSGGAAVGMGNATY
jgi:hypothetical protein